MKMKISISSKYGGIETPLLSASVNNSMKTSAIISMKTANSGEKNSSSA